MIATTREQDNAIEAAGIEYGAIIVSAYGRPEHGAVKIATGPVAVTRRIVGPDGDEACWNCGGNHNVTDRGCYGHLCEWCDDNLRNPL